MTDQIILTELLSDITSLKHEVEELERTNQALSIEDIPADDPRLASLWRLAQRYAKSQHEQDKFSRIHDALSGTDIGGTYRAETEFILTTTISTEFDARSTIEAEINGEEENRNTLVALLNQHPELRLRNYRGSDTRVTLVESN